MLERVISVFAPHECLVCAQEGSLLCSWCRQDSLTPIPPRCYRCHALSPDFKTCTKCRRKTKLSNVWVSTSYEGVAENLIKSLKFNRSTAAAPVIAGFLAETLPYLSKEVAVTYIPTATSRRRQRGYDQSELIAKRLAKSLGLEFKVLLARTGQSRQVGAKRNQRLKQLKRAFRPKNTSEIKKVLLVDDISTTGATLESATETLKKSGVKTVMAAVFAQKN